VYGPLGSNHVYPPCEIVYAFRLDRTTSPYNKTWKPFDEATTLTSLLRPTYQAKTFTQIPSSTEFIDPTLEEASQNFSMFAFPSNIKIGRTEFQIVDVLDSIKQKEKEQEKEKNDINIEKEKNEDTVIEEDKDKKEKRKKEEDSTTTTDSATDSAADSATAQLLQRAATMRHNLMKPKQHSFVGTLGGGQRIYGHCYTILVPLPTMEYDRLHAVSSSYSPPFPDRYKQETTSSATSASGKEGSEGSEGKEETPLPPFPPVIYEPICFCFVTRLPFHRTMMNALATHIQQAPLPPRRTKNDVEHYRRTASGTASGTALLTFEEAENRMLETWCHTVTLSLFVELNTNTPVPETVALSTQPNVRAVLERMAPIYPHITGRRYRDMACSYPLGVPSSFSDTNSSIVVSSSVSSVSSVSSSVLKTSKRTQKQHEQHKQNEENEEDEQVQQEEHEVEAHLPLVDVDHSLLFKALCPRNILRVMRAFMNDQKLLFLSNDVTYLVQMIECFLSLLYPFDGRHLGVYMPVVPKNVALQSDGVLFQMPFQFLMGMR